AALAGGVPGGPGARLVRGGVPVELAAAIGRHERERDVVVGEQTVAPAHRVAAGNELAGAHVRWDERTIGRDGGGCGVVERLDGHDRAGRVQVVEQRRLL